MSVSTTIKWVTVICWLLLGAMIVVCTWRSGYWSRTSYVLGETFCLRIAYSDGAINGDLQFCNDLVLAKYARRILSGESSGKAEVAGVLYGYSRAVDGRLLWVVNVSLWYLGAALAVLPVLQVMRWLRSRRFQFSLRTLLLVVAGIGFLLGAWQITGTVGVRHVFEAVDREGLARGSVRVDYDPLDGPDPTNDPDPTRDCHYLGNASSPFPFIVAFDYSGVAKYPHSHTRYGGTSGRGHYLWFFGLTWPLTHWDRATRYRI